MLLNSFKFLSGCETISFNSPLTSPLINIKDNPLFVSPCHHPVDSMEEHCTFCKIIKGEKPTEFLYQDESLVIFKDIRPHAPIHFLIVPREHIRSLNDLKEKDKDILFKMIVKAKEMAKAHSIAESGYRLVFNVERGGGQVIFHLHLHLLGGW
jgi:histidine triad (HIT) family protein